MNHPIYQVFIFYHYYCGYSVQMEHGDIFKSSEAGTTEEKPSPLLCSDNGSHTYHQRLCSQRSKPVSNCN